MRVVRLSWQSKMTTMMAQINHPNLPLKLMFEDDGRTGYAYLVSEAAGIVADVWLYNSGETPEQAEWKDPALLPFRNPKGYTKPDRIFQLPTRESDIEMTWSTSADGRVGGTVAFRGVVVAKLYEGDKPGMSLMASRDGPVARLLA